MFVVDGVGDKYRFVHGHGDPSQSCREVLQAPSKNAGYFFIKHGKFRDHAWKHFVGLLCSLHYLS